MAIYTEKYRPKTRKDIIGHEEIVSKIFSMVDTGNLTHCIFEGRPGVGKTSCALVIGREIFGENFLSNFLELNASDERGIAVVQGQVKMFAMTSPLNANFKIIFLDEADMLTKEAQTALRRTMEYYSDSTIFIFGVNDISRIIEPLISRCEVFHFGSIPKIKIANRLSTIYKLESGREVDVKGFDALIKIAEISNGDLRKSINQLQAFMCTGKDLDAFNVVNLAFGKQINYGEKIVEKIGSGSFIEARKVFQEALEYGYTERYVLDLIYLTIRDSNIDYGKKAKIIEVLAETDYRLTLGINGGLAMDNLLMKMIGEKINV